MPIIIGVNRVKRKRTKKAAKKITKKKPAKKRTAAKRKGSKMAKAKAKTRIVYRTKEKIRYRTRPAKKVTYKRRNNPKKDDSVELKKIARGALAMTVGMVVAKAAVNKLTEGGSETLRWTWPNIAMAAAASIITAILLGAVFNLKKPTIGLIAAGGVALAMYKAFTTKLAPKWGWSEDWFGADADMVNPQSEGAEVDVFEESDNVSGATSYWGATDSGGQTVPFDSAMGSTDAGGQTVAWNPAMGDDVSNLRRVGNRVAAAYPGSY